MIKSEEKLKNFTAILNKDSIIRILEAVEQLREEQPFEGAVGLLTALYDKTDDYSVRKTIEGFMNDLKDKSARIEVINEIRKPWTTDTTSMLVSSCWQSGLDYSDYAFDLAKVFLKGDYITAIECLTVIEESINEINQKTKNEIIKMINKNPVSPVTEKTNLTLELKSILSR